MQPGLHLLSDRCHKVLFENVFEYLGRKMQFVGAVDLARGTPSGVLCEAWGATAEYVAEIKRSGRPMTVREAGALAELHGMELLDILSI